MKQEKHLYSEIIEVLRKPVMSVLPGHLSFFLLLSAIPLTAPKTEKNRKRVTYNPMLDHDYSQEAPTMREVYPGHYVLCNSEEFNKFQEEYKNLVK